MNNILNQLVNSMDKPTKKEFIRLTKLDLEHCEVELFNGKKYTKKLYGDDLFLFIDDKFRLIGASVGAMYQKSFENISGSLYNTKSDFRKNRSGLEEFAKIIIRIPSDQRIYSYRFNKKYFYNNNNNIYNKSIKERLREYKNGKVENLTKEDVYNMVNEIMDYVMSSLNDKSKLEVFKPIFNGLYLLTAGGIMRTIGSLLDSYESKSRDLEYINKKSILYMNYLDSICEIKKYYDLIK